MGNLRGWGGAYEPSNITGLTANWMEQQRQLQKKIVARERSLGMRTVLGAFAGHVPASLTKHHPAANVSQLPAWAGFSSRWSGSTLLEADDPLFAKIGKAFLEIQAEEYATDHIYNGDTFNEMQPRSADPLYLRSWGSAVYNAMAAADPAAVWLVQGWSIQFWSPGALAAYWSAVPPHNLVVLDLDGAGSATSWIAYANISRPVISALLDNFGGERAFEGPLGQVSAQVSGLIYKFSPNAFRVLALPGAVS
jgi:alpha-N-acetylglucosaminidase